jgi:hypothetical protein
MSYPRDDEYTVSNEGHRTHYGDNTLAIIGFIFSLISLVFFTNFFAPAGLLLSIFGLVKANKEAAPLKGLATWGIIISIVSFILNNFIAKNYFINYFTLR